jgi:hypothetical protein
MIVDLLSRTCHFLSHTLCSFATTAWRKQVIVTITDRFFPELRIKLTSMFSKRTNAACSADVWRPLIQQRGLYSISHMYSTAPRLQST